MSPSACTTQRFPFCFDRSRRAKERLARSAGTVPPRGRWDSRRRLSPASRSTQRFAVDANTRPAAVMSSAPTMSIRRRPIRSARVVMAREITVSPTSVSVSSTPVLLLAEPDAHQVEHQHDRQRSVCEEPNEACRKEQPGVAGADAGGRRAWPRGDLPDGDSRAAFQRLNDVTSITRNEHLSSRHSRVRTSHLPFVSSQQSLG